jgi:hypothetical protein
MSAVAETEEVTLRLSRKTLERAGDIAAREKRGIQDVLANLVDEGLTSHLSIKELLDRASESYRSRLESEGKLHQTADEVLSELSDLRERLASEPHS